jgi:hypothetical protein
MNTAVFLLFLVVILPAIWTAVFCVRQGAGTAKLDKRREAAIKAQNIGKFEQDVIDRQVKVGMTDRMVLAAWGEPKLVHKQKKSRKHAEIVLTYGTPGSTGDTNLITLRDGVVTDTVINQPYQVAGGVVRQGLILIAILFMVWGILFCLLSIGFG